MLGREMDRAEEELERKEAIFDSAEESSNQQVPMSVGSAAWLVSSVV